jgi:hypothetical protein
MSSKQKRRNKMKWIYIVLAFGGPRLALAALWLFQPERFEAAFESWLWPILGFIILPLTTVAFVLVVPNGISGSEWAWLIGAFVADIGIQGGGALGSRQQTA